MWNSITQNNIFKFFLQLIVYGYLLLLAVLLWDKSVPFSTDILQSYYGPQLLNEGYRPYIDFNYVFGPIHLYITSFLFKFFGPSLTILKLISIAIYSYTHWISVKILRESLSEIHLSLFQILLISVSFAPFYYENLSMQFFVPYCFESIYSIAGILTALYFFKAKKDNLDLKNTFVLSLILSLISLARFDHSLMVTLIFSSTYIIMRNRYFYVFFITLPIVFLLTYLPYLDKITIKEILFFNLLNPANIPSDNNYYQESLLFGSIIKLTPVFFITIALAFSSVFFKRNTLQYIFTGIAILLTYTFLQYDTLISALPYICVASVLIQSYIFFTTKKSNFTLLVLSLISLYLLGKIFFGTQIFSQFFYLGVPSLILFFALFFNIQTNKNYFSIRIFTYATIVLILFTQFSRMSLLFPNYISHSYGKLGKIDIPNTELNQAYISMHNYLRKKNSIESLMIFPSSHSLYSGLNLKRRPYWKLFMLPYIQYYGDDYFINYVNEYQPEYVILSTYLFVYANKRKQFNYSYVSFCDSFGVKLCQNIRENYDLEVRFGGNFSEYKWGKGAYELYKKRTQPLQPKSNI